MRDRYDDVMKVFWQVGRLLLLLLLLWWNIWHGFKQKL